MTILHFPKVFFMASAALLMASSCGPSSVTLDMELRYPSKSGLNLPGKSMAIAYVDGGTAADSTFSTAVASGFARRMEEEYFGGQEVIPLYSIPRTPGADYSSVDTLRSLVMDTGEDVVFLFDTQELGEPLAGAVERNSGRFHSADSAYVMQVSVPFKLKVHVYDSMNRDDKVLTYGGAGPLRVNVYHDGTLSSEDSQDGRLGSMTLRYISPAGERVGHQSTGSFLPTWKQEQFTVIYYESGRWEDAAMAAFMSDWRQAVDIWLDLAGSGNLQKRSCAEYDLALGMFMLGDTELALKWLDRSDRDYPVSPSQGLRSRIEAFMLRTDP